MSIWLSKVSLMAAALALAGCIEGEGMSFADFGASRPPAWAKALSQAQLGNGDVILNTPDGWCIEPRSLRNTARQSFAVLAGCHELTSGALGSPAPKGFISVSVGAVATEISGTAEVMDEVVASQRPVARDVERGLSRAEFTPPEDGAGPVWRVVAIVANRPVLLTTHAPKDSALAGPFGQNLATQIAQSLVANAVVQEVAQN